MTMNINCFPGHMKKTKEIIINSFDILKFIKNKLNLY